MTPINFNESLLKQLKLYKTLPLEYYNDDPILKPNPQVPNMGLVNDDNYCEKVDDYNLRNPDNVFKQMNFVTDYNTDGLAR